MSNSAPRIVMYTTAFCPYCVNAKSLLKRKGLDVTEEVRVDLDPSRRDEMVERSGRRTVPQIWINDRHVGGFDDLVALDRAGGLPGAIA